MASIVITSKQDFEKLVLQSSIPVFIDFWAEWCGPCRMVAPIFEELSNQYEGKILFAKLDVDNLPDIASEYGVQSIPTMIAIKGGQEVVRLIGAHQKADYVKEITNLV